METKMRTSSFSRAIAVPCTLLSFTGFGFGLDGSIPENGLDVSTVGEPYAFAYGMHTINANLSTGADVDTFTFHGEAGDDIRVIVDGLSNDMDPKVELFAPTLGAVTATGSQSCSASQFVTCSVLAEFDDLPETGTYTILMSDAGADNAGAYALQLERIPSLDAPVLPYNFSESSVISPATDHDIFVFFGQAGSLIRFQVDGLSNDFDPSIEIIGPSGPVDAASCSASQFVTCSVASFDVTLSETGDHWVVVRDAGSDNPGAYSMSATCIVGCPTLSGRLIRNGSGVNRSCYTSSRPAVPGGCWIAEVDATSHAGATTCFILFYGAGDSGSPSPWGELLVDLSSGLLARLSAPVGASGTSEFVSEIPNDVSLVGFSTASQAAILGGGVELCNAIDYVVGY